MYDVSRGVNEQKSAVKVSESDFVMFLRDYNLPSFPGFLLILCAVFKSSLVC